MSEELYPFDRVVSLLRLLKAKGTFGSTEIFWTGDKITGIKHHESFKPNDLPQVVQPT